MVILYPASLRRIMILLIKNSRINKSSMLILLQFKKAFAGHFYSELQKCFQLALLMTHSLTTLGTAGKRTDSLCLASQWKWGKSDSCSLVFNNLCYSQERTKGDSLKKLTESNIQGENLQIKLWSTLSCSNIYILNSTVINMIEKLHEKRNNILEQKE